MTDRLFTNFTRLMATFWTIAAEWTSIEQAWFIDNKL
jgi:hypothetical protein